MTALPDPTPFLMPAEWAPHEATWWSWPHSEDTWPHELPQVEKALALAVRALAPRETVCIGTLDARHETHVRGVLDAAGVRGDVRFFPVPTDDAWARDHGALFVKHRDTGARAATVWGFNAWGGKYAHSLDARVGREMARIFEAPVIEGGIVLEGGSIEPNGAGTILTTKACLLHPNRNPGLSQADLEGVLGRFLGARQVLWLGQGIEGDDTDGHVDDLTRFVAEDTVVTVVEEDRLDDNYDALQHNLELLHTMTLFDGRPLRVETLPMPRPVVTRGLRLPASYANFYVANGVVLVPTFDDPADAPALATLARLFAGREVVPIPCRDVIWGQGALHCLTQQVPVAGW